MCQIEHVFHTPCSHWGRERFVGEPCIRSRVVEGRHVGCGYIENLGSTNSKELCYDCKYREVKGPGWRPFEGISDDGWMKVEEKRRKQSDCGIREGTYTPSSPSVEYGSKFSQVPFNG